MNIDRLEKCRREIRTRLDEGFEIELFDAIELFDIRTTGYGSLSDLSELDARGRCDDWTAPYSEIPNEAWPYIKWKTDGMQAWAVTSTGRKIFLVRLSKRRSEPQPPTIASSSTVLTDAAKLLLEPDAAVLKIASEPHKVWTLVDYSEALAAAGLRVSPDKHRVSGVHITEVGCIQRGNSGSALLRNLLLVARDRLLASGSEVYDLQTHTDRARNLLSWLSSDHPVLAEARHSIDEKRIKAVVELLRKAKLLPLRLGASITVREYQ